VQVPSLDDPDSPASSGLVPRLAHAGGAGAVDHSRTTSIRDNTVRGVFYSLGELKPNNIVEITRADGSVAVFAIDDVRSYPKANFRTLAVYGNLDHAACGLITCGGQFDPATPSSYESNIVGLRFAGVVPQGLTGPHTPGASGAPTHPKPAGVTVVYQPGRMTRLPWRPADVHSTDVHSTHVHSTNLPGPVIGSILASAYTLDNRRAAPECSRPTRRNTSPSPAPIPLPQS